MDYAYLTENVETASGEIIEGEPEKVDIEQSGEAAAEGDPVGEGQGESVKAETAMTMLVMQESQCSSVWAYAVEKKGASEEWIAPQILEDMETVGLQGEKVVMKSDQEASIVDVARPAPATMHVTLPNSRRG